MKKSLIILLVLTLPALAAADTRVNVGSPSAPFPQNKQNEPSVAIDPSNPALVAAGANDEIDHAPCSNSSCPFTPGVGTSGIYFSFDGGSSWSQPTYTGYSARNGTPGPGPIGTLPNYIEKGLVSDGDPVLAFGPRLDGSGNFAWANGSRLYYSNLASNVSTQRDEQTFRGFEAIVVSHVDDLQAAAAGNQSAWSAPVIVSGRQSQTTFSDKASLWADNAESSPYFGNVYVCWVSFRSLGSAPQPVMFSRSTNGGNNFSVPRQLSEAANNSNKGRQGCTMRTDSQGTIYLFWEDAFQGQSIQVMARSFDGGVSFERKRAIANVTDVGALDPSQGTFTFDGVAGARTNSFLSVDIANGAPTGGGPNTIVAVWADARHGLNDEEALLQYSTDRGVTWSTPTNIAQAGDRPNFPWVAISPDGSDAYVTYNSFLAPWQTSLANPRPFQGVVRHADFGGSLGSWTDLYRANVGDARASSANSLAVEFLGDYNFIGATNDGAVAVWNDARVAADCPAVDAFRAYLAGIGSQAPAPAPGSDCPATFGNTDIFGGVFADPTP